MAMWIGTIHWLSRLDTQTWQYIVRCWFVCPIAQVNLQPRASAQIYCCSQNADTMTHVICEPNLLYLRSSLFKPPIHPAS